jgi:ketosteroid isomerase-like protein
VEAVKRMSEEKIVSVIRDFAEAHVKPDVEKMLSFLTDDVVRISPEGTFKGKEEVKRYLTWDAQTAPNTFPLFS